MSNKKDYEEYFDRLFDIEVDMEQEALKLQKLVSNKKAKEILSVIIEDEIRHKGIVVDLRNLVI